MANNLEEMKAIRLGERLKSEIEGNIRAYRSMGSEGTKASRKISFSLKNLKKNLENIRRYAKFRGKGFVESELFPEKGIRVLNSGTKGVRRLSGETKKLTIAGKKNETMLQAWWKRFGEVGLGFTLVYRAMNAVEAGLRAFIGTIGEAIRESGEFVEIHGRLAMMGTIFGSNAKNFNQAFQLSYKNMKAFRDATVKAISPVQDLMQGLDEMAQWGYIIPSRMMKAFVNFEDFTLMVAATTGSSARQVRQEFQALAQGIKRPGNILVNLIERLQGGKKLVANIVSGGVRGQAALYKIINFISKKMGKLKEIMSESSPTMAWQIGFKNLTFTMMDTILASNKLANAMKLNVGKQGNIFAYTITQAFDKMRKTFSTPVFQGAFATDMVMFNKIVLRMVDSFDKLATKAVVLVASLNYLPETTKRIISIFWRFLRVTMALFALKSAGGLFVGVLKSVWLPMWKIITGVRKLAVRLVTVRRAIEGVSLVTKIHNGLLAIWHKLQVKINKAQLGFVLESGAVIAAFLAVLATALYVYGRLGEVKKAAKETAKGVWWEFTHPISYIAMLNKEVGQGILHPIDALNAIFSKAKVAIKNGGKGVADGFHKIKKEITPEISGLMKQFTGIFTKYFPKGAVFKAGLEPSLRAKITKQMQSLIKASSGSLQQAFQDALNRGDFSFAKKLIPHLEAENKRAIESLKKQHLQLAIYYQKTKDKSVLSAMWGVEGKMRTLEAKNYLKQYYNAVKKESDKATKAQLEKIRKEVRAKADAFNQEQAILEKRKQDERQIQDDIDRARGNSYAVFARQLADKVKKFREDGVSEVTISKWETSQIGQYWKNLGTKTKEVLSNIQKFSNSIAQAMTQGFSDFFFDAMQGKLKSLGDYLSSFLSSIERAFSGMMASSLMSEIGGSKGIAKFITGIFSANGNILKGGFQAFASGGIVTKPTLGLVGEGRYNEAVVPLPDGRSIPVKGGAPNVEINVINKGQPVDAIKGQVRFDGKKWVLDVVLNAIQTEPNFRNAIRSV